MDIGHYYVNQIPPRPMVITVLDQFNAPVPVGGYDSVRLRMLDTDNREIDTSGFVIGARDSSQGTVVVGWPEHSVFKRPGEYVMQLELRSGNAVEYTSERTIIVRTLGGK